MVWIVLDFVFFYLIFLNVKILNFSTFDTIYGRLHNRVTLRQFVKAKTISNAFRPKSRISLFSG